MRGLGLASVFHACENPDQFALCFFAYMPRLRTPTGRVPPYHGGGTRAGFSGSRRIKTIVTRIYTLYGAKLPLETATPLSRSLSLSKGGLHASLPRHGVVPLLQDEDGCTLRRRRFAIPHNSMSPGGSAFEGGHSSNRLADPATAGQHPAPP